MQSEVEHALSRSKHGKVAGPDYVDAEELSALEDFGIKLLTRVMNEVYDAGCIPNDLFKSVFVALPKRSGTIECQHHRTISLMSHATKLLIRVIMMRIRNKIKLEITPEQCGFVEGKGTSNAIYMLRTIAEMALEMQNKLYLCFVDYTKALDCLNHLELIKLIESLIVDGRDLRVIRNLYWQQIAAVRWENELSGYKPTQRGITQGCVLSPHLFAIYSEFIMRNIQDFPGIKIGGHMINHIRYADDIVLIASSQEHLQKLLNIVVTESENVGLTLKVKKFEAMIITKSSLAPASRINIGPADPKHVDKFKYLGTIITKNGRREQEIRSRIAQSKQAFNKIKNILTNKHLSFQIRERVLLFSSVLLFSPE